MNESSSNNAAPKLWGGRFTGKSDPVMEKFNNSISYDKIMWEEDIIGSISYAEALGRCNILEQDEVDLIKEGLLKVLDEWKNGTFEIKSSDEDIHTANERRLTEIIGKVGGKLHTGRSRNDQVATDVRLWLRKSCMNLLSLLEKIVLTSADFSEKYIDILQAGYTHMVILNKLYLIIQIA